jgi:hypothetical protein
MKHVPMKQRKDKAIPVHLPGSGKVEGAFDLWLQRGLHQLYDDVAREPIPEELLRLIEEDRQAEASGQKRVRRPRK